MLRTLSTSLALITIASSLFAQQTTIPVSEDVMTSAFFQGDNRVRGYANETPLRDAHRVASNLAFGSGPETVYMTFDYDFPGSFDAPVANATLHVTSVLGGFDAEGSADNPFQMAVSAVAENPLTAITDDSNPNGTIAWDDFFADSILEPNPNAITTVTGVGELQFDVTSLVNQWIDESNSIYAVALHGKADSLSDGNVLHGIANNSATAEVSHFLTVSIPEPNSTYLGLVASIAGLAIIRSRRV